VLGQRQMAVFTVSTSTVFKTFRSLFRNKRNKITAHRSRICGEVYHIKKKAHVALGIIGARTGNAVRHILNKTVLHRQRVGKLLYEAV
jgi:hypothetical protein